jgi:hypothetical protein
MDPTIVLFIAVVAAAMIIPLIIDMVLAYIRSNKSGSGEVKPPEGIPGLYRTLMTFGIILLLGIIIFYVLWLVSGNLNTQAFSPLVDLLQNLSTILGTALATIIAFYFGIRGTSTSVEKAAEAMISSKTDDSTPIIINTNPADGEVEIPVTSLITASFNRAISQPTLNLNNFSVKKDDGTQIQGILSLSSDSKTALFDPVPDLEKGTKYNVHIAAEVKDLTGKPLSPPKRWSFTTEKKDEVMDKQQQQEQTSTSGPISLNPGTATQENPSGPISLSSQSIK